MQCRVVAKDVANTTLLLPQQHQWFTLPNQLISGEVGDFVEVNIQPAPKNDLIGALRALQRELEAVKIQEIDIRVTCVTPWSFTLLWSPKWRLDYPKLLSIIILVNDQQAVRLTEGLEGEERLRIFELEPDTEYTLQLLFKHAWGTTESKLKRQKTLGLTDLSALNISTEHEIGLRVIPFDPSETAVVVGEEGTPMAEEAKREGIPIVGLDWVLECQETNKIAPFF